MAASWRRGSGRRDYRRLRRRRWRGFRRRMGAGRGCLRLLGVCLLRGRRRWRGMSAGCSGGSRRSTRRSTRGQTGRRPVARGRGRSTGVRRHDDDDQRDESEDPGQRLVPGGPGLATLRRLGRPVRRLRRRRTEASLSRRRRWLKVGLARRIPWLPVPLPVRLLPVPPVRRLPSPVAACLLPTLVISPLRVRTESLRVLLLSVLPLRWHRSSVITWPPLLSVLPRPPTVRRGNPASLRTRANKCKCLRDAHPGA